MVMPIRWGDMDAMGHVNNTLYFRYMEVIRIEWFHLLLGGAPDRQAVGPIIINAFCTFHRQLEYPGDVRARLYVGAMGRSTIDTYTTLERTDEPGLVYASGGAAVVWTDFRARKSVPLPDDVRQRLTGSTGE
ncbi:MAG: acyl-CoA thioesterase [Aquabacterium sp.]